MDYNYTRMELGQNHHRSEFKSVHTELNEELLKKPQTLKTLPVGRYCPIFIADRLFLPQCILDSLVLFLSLEKEAVPSPSTSSRHVCAFLGM